MFFEACVKLGKIDRCSRGKVAETSDGTYSTGEKDEPVDLEDDAAVEYGEADLPQPDGHTAAHFRRRQPVQQQLNRSPV